jgi:hypothetical protein
MRRKLIYLVSFVLVLGLVGSASAALVARWQFNDETANDSVGTLNWDPNAVTYSTDAREGGKSVSFDGVGAYLSQAATGPLADAFITKTVSLWFKADTTIGVQVLYDQGGSTNGLAIRINNGQLETAVQNRNSISIASTPFTGTDWTHVAATFDRGQLTLYVDGTEAGSVTADFAGVIAHTNIAGLGARAGQDAFDNANTGDFFGGLIDEVRLYSEALTPSQIACLAVPEKA